MGDLDERFFRADGSQRDTDEDGKHVGDFHNPNDRGGEDLPHRLSGQPLQTPPTPAVPARGTVQDDGYIHGDNGAYYSPSGYHTGEDTAEANGVTFADESMDGM